MPYNFQIVELSGYFAFCKPTHFKRSVSAGRFAFQRGGQHGNHAPDAPAHQQRPHGGTGHPRHHRLHRKSAKDGRRPTDYKLAVRQPDRRWPTAFTNAARIPISVPDGNSASTPCARITIPPEAGWGDTVSTASFSGSTLTSAPLLFFVSQSASSRMILSQ